MNTKTSWSWFGFKTTRWENNLRWLLRRTFCRSLFALSCLCFNILYLRGENPTTITQSRMTITKICYQQPGYVGLVAGNFELVVLYSWQYCCYIEWRWTWWNDWAIWHKTQRFSMILNRLSWMTYVLTCHRLLPPSPRTCWNTHSAPWSKLVSQWLLVAHTWTDPILWQKPLQRASCKGVDIWTCPPPQTYAWNSNIEIN